LLDSFSGSKRALFNAHAGREERMNTSQIVELISSFLSEVTRTLNTVALSERLANAKSDEERSFLAQALAALMSQNSGTPRGTSQQHMPPYYGQGF